MQIILYVTTSEPNRVKKTLNNANTLQGTLKTETSIMNPVIDIAGTNTILSYNYCYIPDFKRYYFITDIVVVRNGLFRLSLSVDVLQTYWNELQNLKVIVARQENRMDAYLNDDKQKVRAYDKIYTVMPSTVSPFGKEFSYVLLVAGSGGQ